VRQATSGFLPAVPDPLLTGFTASGTATCPTSSTCETNITEIRALLYCQHSAHLHYAIAKPILSLRASNGPVELTIEADGPDGLPVGRTLPARTSRATSPAKSWLIQRQRIAISKRSTNMIKAMTPTTHPVKH
jgi:hypothetical protein